MSIQTGLGLRYTWCTQLLLLLSLLLLLLLLLLLVCAHQTSQSNNVLSKYSTKESSVRDDDCERDCCVHNAFSSTPSSFLLGFQ